MHNSKFRTLIQNSKFRINNSDSESRFRMQISEFRVQIQNSYSEFRIQISNLVPKSSARGQIQNSDSEFRFRIAIEDMVIDEIDTFPKIFFSDESNRWSLNVVLGEIIAHSNFPQIPSMSHHNTRLVFEPGFSLPISAPRRVEPEHFI